SIGPYVLSGGELPAMVLVDAVARRLPGALADGSGEHESFSEELAGGVEYPHYTRPPSFQGWDVPDVLLSGDHGRIAGWRLEQSRLRSVRCPSRLPGPVAAGRRPARPRTSTDCCGRSRRVAASRGRAGRPGIHRTLPRPRPVGVAGPRSRRV